MRVGGAEETDRNQVEVPTTTANGHGVVTYRLHAAVGRGRHTVRLHGLLITKQIRVRVRR